MRGKPHFFCLKDKLIRLIPAHAGKTSSSTSASGSAPAHPRACGENLSCVFYWLSFRGSSPRMRGKLPRNRANTSRIGLIPAHAGKTPYSLVGSFPSPAHPRACGENFIRYFQKSWKDGSSPRMRGKQHSTGSERPADRLIPAHAGKTPGVDCAI